MNTLKGYVRELAFCDDDCIMLKPNIYYRTSNCDFEEIIVKVEDLCQELVDYLEYQSRLMPRQFDGSNNVEFNIISLYELNNKYDELKDENIKLFGKFRSQLNQIIVKSESIGLLGDLDPDTMYLEFTIS